MNASTVVRMAEAIDTAQSPTCPESVGVYVIANGGQISIKRGDARDYASMRASQLASLLTVIQGEGGSSFRSCNESIQDDVLWLASGLADELKDLVQIVHDDARPTRTPRSRG